MIIADDREQTGAIPFLPSSIESNNKKYSKLNELQGGGKITMSTMRMTTGDYNIVFREKIYLTLERKTWKDLAASIKDGRANKQNQQMENLKNKTNCKTLYIIEGSKKGKNNKIGQISISTLETKLRRIFLRGSSYVITKSQKETADLIVGFTRDIMRLVASGELIFTNEPQNLNDAIQLYNNELALLNKQFDHLIIKYGNDLKKHIYSTNNNAGNENANNINDNNQANQANEVNETNEANEVNETNEANEVIQVNKDNNIINLLTQQHVKTNSDIVEAMWMSLKSVSDKTYPMLIEKYKIQDFICINSIKKYKELIQEVAKIQYVGSGMRIGEKRAKLMLMIGYPGKIQKNIDLKLQASIRLLSQIPGVSEDSAKFILEQCSLQDICLGKISINFLSELERENGRRLGKIGETIINQLVKFN
jgi:ERCC4-type nuclease